MQEPRPIRVALSNDYEIALLGLAAMLALYSEVVQIVELTTDVALRHDPDVILFDTFGRVPEDDRKLRLVVEANPSAKVAVYSWEAYPEEAALGSGAVGYLHKSLDAEALVRSVVALHEGRRPEVTRGDGDAPLSWPGQAEGLTEHEAEVLTFLVRGLTNDEIASRSYRSVNTVKSHLRTAYRKIGVQSRSQAVAWGLRHGFASTDDVGL